MAAINKKYIRKLAYVITGLLCLALLLRFFVFEIYRVEKDSMNNSYFNGDRVVVNKFSRNNIARNDVLVFRHNDDVYIKRCIGLPGETVEIKKGKVFINAASISFPSKAILPDTTLPASANDKQLSNIVMLDIYGQYWDLDNFGPYTIPKKGMTIRLTPGNLKLYHKILEQDEMPADKPLPANSSYTFQHDYFFVLGDNRPRSDDSRIFGAISKNQVIGKSGFVLR